MRTSPSFGQQHSWLTVSLALAALALTSPATASEPLVAHFLANEGLLLVCGQDKVLVDAFIPEPHSLYGAVPETTWQAMLNGEPPFDHVPLALASHVHRDHLQPEAAVAFLRRHPETVLLTSPEVAAAVRSAEGGEAVAEQLRETLPEPGEIHEHTVGGVRVEVLRLLHTSERNRHIQNLGHVLHLCGSRSLHVGDAALRAESFRPYAETLTGLERAFLPFWYFLGDSRAELEALIPANHWFAVHVPPEEREQRARQIAEGFPEVHVPRPAAFNRAARPAGSPPPE